MDINKIKELLNTGENSSVEFKRDDINGEALAIVIVSFLNGSGGVILLGVEDDGRISGIKDSSDKKMNWISQVCQDMVKPPVIPEMDLFGIDGKDIIGVNLDKGSRKPSYLIKNEKTLFYIRVGTTCRLASPEQISILYANQPGHHHDATPVQDMPVESLDERRIRHYFLSIRKLSEKYYRENKDNLCINSRIGFGSEGKMVPTVGGCLLFGNEPSRFLMSAGMQCAAFDGTTKDYSMKDKKFLDSPILPCEHNGIVSENGLIEKALGFVEMNTRTTSAMNGIRRIDTPEYPIEAVREAVANALVHRDYSLIGGTIQLLLFSDRIEIHSPGRLPNTLNLDMIKTGASYARNPIIMKFVENYGYVEHLGMGIPEKIIKPMLERGYPEPGFIDNGYAFIVRLKKE